MSDRDDPVERALDDALSRLPRHAAPPELARRIAARPPAGAAPRSAPRWRAIAAPLAAGLALAAGVALYYERVVIPSVRATASLDVEAVNDHLRLLTSEHPLDVESGGIHRVKPWFAGKLDFAPTTAFAGDDDFPLQGGAVSWFLDRKAAAFVYKRRLHAITLLVFRADGLALPTAARASRSRGYNLVLWRDGELGYALISDVDAAELAVLRAKITPG